MFVCFLINQGPRYDTKIDSVIFTFSVKGHRTPKAEPRRRERPTRKEGALLQTCLPFFLGRRSTRCSVCGNVASFIQKSSKAVVSNSFFVTSSEWEPDFDFDATASVLLL